ncbi:S8 family serine peptidase [Candidatus Bipolaricaulota bacterium]|nr:S8 family serine peptidase [Candidatus Bipolaricaulota bacterium]TFH10184.1 MAG: Subtilisin DY [Candidatus Atribacteria bacterium]
MKKQWLPLGGLILLIGLAISSCTWLQPTSLGPRDYDPLQTIEVVVDGDLTDAVVAELGSYGQISGRIDAIGGVVMQVSESAIPALAGLPFVRQIGSTAERFVHDYADGISTWDLDLINVTDLGVPRVTPYDGTGVYVAVLDTGLVENWRDYLPEDRIAVEYAKAFNSGQSENTAVADVPHLWERDTNSHGTHVTSTVLGYWVKSLTTPYAVNGVAPMATVIPVKVLSNAGSGWSPGIAAGIVYITDLKIELDAPMVINMSLGGPELSPLEAAAIDYALANNVVVVASAGNNGLEGMGYPGAYEPVISVGSIGWINEWSAAGWWRLDVPEPLVPSGVVDLIYVSDFSGRELPGQDLDVLAPGSWVVGPYLGSGAATPQLWSNGTPGEYFYLGGTSMASPHVAGLVALMFDKNPNLIATQVEGILESAAISLPAGSKWVDDGSGVLVEYIWGDDATGSGIVLTDLVLGAI